MKKFLYILAATGIIIGFIVAFIVLVMSGAFALETFLLPENCLFYEQTPVFSKMLGSFITVSTMAWAAVVLSAVRKKILGRQSVDDEDWNVIDTISCFMTKLGKWSIVLTVLCLILEFVCLTNLTYVTEDKIVKISTFNLKGTEYAYRDVEKIETGFGDKKHSFKEYEKKGSFYYIVYLDSEKCVFHKPSVVSTDEKYIGYGRTYLELEEFDAALTALEIPKTSSRDGYENCDFFDTCYVERFLRIIDGKSLQD